MSHIVTQTRVEDLQDIELNTFGCGFDAACSKSRCMQFLAESDAGKDFASGLMKMNT